MSPTFEQPGPAKNTAASAPLFDYEMECDWHLLWTCNYRCGYCFFSPEKLGSKLTVFAAPEEWEAVFDATGKRCPTARSGGLVGPGGLDGVRGRAAPYSREKCPLA